VIELKPLAGLRVLDFCWIGAGALVTKTLAELGASVYRIESRVHPDNLRLSPPFRPGAENLEGSGYFASRNPSKKSVAINMSTEEGREIAFRLATTVDVVTSNFRPGIMERWGFTYPHISAVNPSVIFLTMPMQGADGPHATYIGFGSTISALSGLVNLSGKPGRTPVGTGTHYPDHVPNPGHTLVALLAAIRHRRRTGQGQAIELSQLESTINVLGPAVLETSAGQSAAAAGNRVGDAAPHSSYRCKDGLWCVVSCHTDAHWEGLRGVVGRPGLDEDPRFRTVLDRKRNEDLIDEIVAAAAAEHDRAGFIAALDAAGVPNAPVKSSRDIVEDPVLWGRGFWQDVEHPVIGHLPIARTPFLRVDSPRADLAYPPLLGEHTGEVLSAELGMGQDEIDDLAAREVLY
jgi:benzylsuccinate CoA-transferase BbsF subunit